MLLSDRYRAALTFAFDLRTMLADYRVVGEALWERFTGGREGVLWYYGSLAETFTLDNPVVRDLRAAAAELTALCSVEGVVRRGES